MESQVSVPLRGVGCFWGAGARSTICNGFPSPCGVWVVSPLTMQRSRDLSVSVPLRGVGCFPCPIDIDRKPWVSVPLRGVGCFSSSIRSLRYRAVSVPLRGVGCFGKAAHSFWCNRKRNCQLCYFIVSYWQMFINSKLRNCKVPCEVHKTAT